MKYVPTYEEFLNENWKDSMSAFNEYQEKWTTEMLKFLQGKKLGSLVLSDIKSEFDGIVEFTVQIDELILNWMVKSEDGPEKPKVYIGISSPNKRGAFEKTVTGRNASNEKVWKTIQDIYNGRYRK
jgi:hypothetical protein